MTETEKYKAQDNLTILNNSLREIKKFAASLNIMIETAKEVVDDSEVHAYLTLIGVVCDKLEGLADDYYLPNKLDFLVRIIKNIEVEKGNADPY